jgi:predicted nucleic acid-binding protein
LNAKGEEQIREFIRQMSVFDINDEIKTVTIELRRKHRLKLPDAIICATAIVFDAELISNDEKLLAVPGLRVVSVRLI